MKRSLDEVQLVTPADIVRPQGQILKGQYVGAFRSEKGKVKGLVLRVEQQEYTVKLPKYLRPILARELAPQAFVQVWAYPDEATWRAVNIMLLPDVEAVALQAAWGLPPERPTQQPAETRSQPICLQVCGKGKCYKQGSRQIAQILQAEVNANPALQHVTVETVGCLKECKQGPNMRVGASGRVVGRVTPASALEMLERCK